MGKWDELIGNVYQQSGGPMEVVRVEMRHHFGYERKQASVLLRPVRDETVQVDGVPYETDTDWENRRTQWLENQNSYWSRVKDIKNYSLWDVVVKRRAEQFERHQVIQLAAEKFVEVFDVLAGFGRHEISQSYDGKISVAWYMSGDELDTIGELVGTLFSEVDTDGITEPAYSYEPSCD